MKTHRRWITKSLLSASLALLGTACMSRGNDDLDDPVARLLAVRYLKVVDELGPHRVEATTEIEAEGAGGNTLNVLYEELDVDERSSYRVRRRQQPTEDPWELISIGSAYYVVNPDGRVETLQPGMLGQHTRERVAESWRTVLKEFQYSVHMVRTGDSTFNGRSVVEHTIELDPNARPPKDVPAVSEVSGKVRVDAATGFPVQMELKGAYLKEMPQGAVTVRLRKFTFELKDFGQVALIKAPRSTTRKGAPKGTQ